MWLTKALTICIPLAMMALKRRSNDDALTLQGTWSVVSSEFEGRSATSTYRNWRLIFKGDTLQMTDGFAGPEPAKFKIEQKSLPRAIDLRTGKHDNKVVAGIYAVEKDSLKLCLSTNGKRPSDFKTKPGDQSNLFVLKREQRDVGVNPAGH